MTPADELYAQLLKMSMGIDPFTSEEDRDYSCNLEKMLGAPITWDYRADENGMLVYTTEEGRAWMRAYEEKLK